MQYNKNTIYSVNNVLKSIKDRRYSTNNSRYLSWEDCHTAFLDVYNEGFNCNSVDVLALHLSGYLASWGMYRGSSDLLREYRYLVHKDIIEQLYSSKNLPLFNVDQDNFKQNIPLIESVYSNIENFYNSLICNNKQFKASETLITRILLGVYGCVPAYDRFMCYGLKYYGIQKSGKNKFQVLCDWINQNPDFLSDIIKFKKSNFNHYPFMKIVDMYFWELGYTLKKEGENK